MQADATEQCSIVLAGTSAQAVNWNAARALEAEGGAFAQVAQTFDSWIEKLWEQNGDGRALVSRAQARLAAEATVAGHRFESLRRTPGLAQALCECARKGFGVPSFDVAVEHAWRGEPIGGEAEFTDPEREVLACLHEYAQQLENHNLIELGDALRCLAARSGELFDPGTFVRFLGGDALTAQQFAFFAACPQLVLVHDENLEPAPLSRVAPPRSPAGQALDAGPGTASAASGADGAPCASRELPCRGGGALPGAAPDCLPDVAPGPAVRMAFPSGRYAQAPLLLDVIGDVLAESPEEDIVVSSADPVALYEKLAPALVQRGVSCSVQGTTSAGSSDFGKAFLAACAVHDGDGALWSKESLTDVLHSSFVGADKASVWGRDARMRGDRLAVRDAVLRDVRGDALDEKPPSARAFSGLDDLACASGIGDVGGAVSNGADPDGGSPDGAGSPDAADDPAGAGRAIDDELFASRFCSMMASGLPRAYVQEQQATCRAIAEIIRAVEKFGCADGALVERLVESARFSCARAAYPPGKEPSAGTLCQVRFMSQQKAAQLAAGSAGVVVVCDLTTESYPLRESRSAASSLLARLGAGPRDTALARARRSFSALVRVPRSLLVLERCLNDANADPYYPSAMLEEFANAYRADDPALRDARLERRYGFPTELLRGRYERGEEDLLQDLRPGADGANARRVAWPQRGGVERFAGKVAPVEEAAGDGALPRLSASQLENYLECPYKWFVSNRCKATEVDEGFGSREIGSFLHEVFQEFYGRFGEKVNAQNLGRARNLMFGAAGEPGVFDRVAAAQYETDENGHAHPSRLVPVPGTSEEYEIAQLRARVEQWLQFETTFLPAFRPVAFECRIPDVEYEGCIVRGVIDRIDVDAAGRAVVIDYKGSLKGSHKALSKNEFNESGKVQALMYARILQDAGAIVVEPADEAAGRKSARSSIAVGVQAAGRPGSVIRVSEVVGALYVSYNKGNKVQGAFDAAAIGVPDIPTLVSASACELLPQGETSFAAALDFTARRVNDGVRRMRADEVEPAPNGPEACAYCPVIDCESRCL